MSKLTAFAGSTSGLIAGVGIFFVGSFAVGSYLGILMPKGDAEMTPVMVAQPVETTPDAVITPDATVADAKPDPVEQPAAETTPSAPLVQEVRSEADGLTVIAGRAEPNSDVILFVDGVENITVQTGSDGAYAAVTFLTPNGDPQVLSIVQRIDGVDLAADDIILAPRQVVVAAVEPEPAVVPDTTEPAVADQDEATADTAVTDTTDADIAVADIAVADIAVADSAVVDSAVTAPASPTVTTDTPAETTTTLAAAQDITPDPTDPETIVRPLAKTVTQATPDAAQDPQAEDVAIIKADEDGVEIINRSSAPEVMANVAIDTISYSQGGDVLLSGRAQSQASAVRVYLDNTVITTLEVDTEGRWRGDLPDVDTGIYTLRVDEVDEGGDVTSRVETPFKREAPAVLVAAQTGVDKPVKAVTVQTGATLWAIARDRYGDGTLFVRVLDANKDSIRDPDLIYPGQVFELPE
jgi:nucleoid-associated protein YgaU